MSERSKAQPESEADEARIPVFQQILDNPFLLLFLGVTIPTVLYILMARSPARWRNSGQGSGP
jgi:hypothetical protein